MINVEAAKVLLDASRNIYRWAKKGDKPEDAQTVVTKRAHEAAWRSVAHLIPVLEHAKESDLYWKLLDNAIRLNKSAKEQQRLHSIAKQEDRGFMQKKAELEKLISDAVFIEKADPRGLTKKADVEERRKIDIAGKARDVEQGALGKALKFAKTVKEKKELSERYETSYKKFADYCRMAKDEQEAVYLKLGLTPMLASQKFLKAQKTLAKAEAKKST